MDYILLDAYKSMDHSQGPEYYGKFLRTCAFIETNFELDWFKLYLLILTISFINIFSGNQVCNVTQKCNDDYGNKFSLDMNCYVATMCTCLTNSLKTNLLTETEKDEHTAISGMFEIGPYLYPFSIEFNILIGNYDS